MTMTPRRPRNTPDRASGADRDDDRGRDADRGRDREPDLPPSLPSPDAGFHEVGRFASADEACRNCYNVAAIAYLDDCEARFRQDGTLPDDPAHLRALIGLLMRRIRWNEWGNADALFDNDAPFRGAILRKLGETPGRD